MPVCTFNKYIRYLFTLQTYLPEKIKNKKIEGRLIESLFHERKVIYYGNLGKSLW